MYTSFYTAAQGVVAQQKRMDVIANNMANISNYGYKSKNATFFELMHYNLNNANGEDTTIKAGTGTVVTKTNTDFTPNAMLPTENPYDFAIKGQGFFMLRNPQNNEITYTRNGRFSLSQRGNAFFLVNDNGNYVLDKTGRQIQVTGGKLSSEIGVYRFNVLDGMLSVGDNEFQPTAKNGNPVLDTNAEIKDHALEASGVDLAQEMSHVIESQRAYSYAMRMVQTSDEIVGTINTLRQ